MVTSMKLGIHLGPYFKQEIDFIDYLYKISSTINESGLNYTEISLEIDDKSYQKLTKGVLYPYLAHDGLYWIGGCKYNLIPIKPIKPIE